MVTNKESSQIAYIHLIPYTPEVQIVHNRSRVNLFSLRKGEGEGGDRLCAACKFFRISCFLCVTGNYVMNQKAWFLDASLWSDIMHLPLN